MVITILHHYLVWHYSRAFLELFHVWKNLLWFVVHFFSMPQMVRSLFAPWKRMQEEREKNWNFEDFAGTLFVNLLSRVIGMILRTIVLVIGLATLLFTFFGGLACFVLWSAAPALVVFLLILGISYII